MTEPTREVELKAVVDDLRACRHAIEEAGARLTFAGRLEDRRYDTHDRSLAPKDVVLRLRTYHRADGARAHLEWKGPTQVLGGFKMRDELATGISDPEVLATMLEYLGYVTIREIDRDVAQYALGGPSGDTMVRFERYPRMDTLVEVEGAPEGIEHAISVLPIPRSRFTTDRLPDFVRAYENRTGVRAALSDRELAGEYRYSVRDA